MNEYDISAAFEAIEQDLIASMIRNMDRHHAEEVEEGFEWAMWQVEQLKALEKYKLENQKKYSKQFKSINAQMGELIWHSRQKGGMEQEAQILRAIKNGFKSYKPASAAMQAEFFKLNTRKLEALINATTHDMKKAETAILRRANDQYRKAIFNAQVYANSGAGTYEKAVDMAIKDMLSRGLACVEYKNGTLHTLEDYADMAIRTATKRAYLQGEGEKRQEWGISTVIINKRGNPCPKCLLFVGKVLIDDVWSGGKASDGPYPLMSLAIKRGLYHPRCKDSHGTYFPGISTAEDTWTRKELDSIGQKYKQEQDHQYAKRQADKFGRLAEHSLDPENKKNYGRKEKEWKQRLAKYQQSDIIKTDGWSNEAIDRRRLDEASIAGHKSEYGILYDASGNRLFKKHGGKHEIVYTPEEALLMRGGVLTHNHPEGATFSPDDISVLGDTGLSELRAIGRDGIYVLKQPKEWPEAINTLEKMYKEYEDIQKALEKDMHEEYLSGRINTNQDYSIEYQKRIVEQLTDKFGLTYFKEAGRSGRKKSKIWRS
ncbi:MAG: minor capsid protein [Lacrimispora sp.]|uniref:phage minor capsid protein n=1 Tax=Lacrimispora sp. TaxID=2719234 RepID=UPI0039E33A98